jgi:hypothetical protein
MSTRRVVADPKAPPDSSWRRYALGGLSLALLAGAVALTIWPPERVEWMELKSACWRIGLLCAVFWLAFHQLRRIPVWLWAMLPVALIVLARRPQWLLFLVPLLLVIAILKPRRR